MDDIELMRAEIRSLYSPDISDLVHFHPVENEFAFLLTLMIGPVGGHGEESFDITVCSPPWLINKYGTNDILFPLYHLIMFEYDYNRLVGAIEKKINGLDGENWNELALKIGKIARWEFEDFRNK